jgi:hypothetical protein
MNIALIENDVVVNVIVADSLEIAETLTNLTVVDADALGLHLGSFKENGVWYPPKPEGEWVWHEPTSQWVTLEMFNAEKENKLIIGSAEDAKEVLEAFFSQTH